MARFMALDLFTPLVEPAKWHQNFKFIREEEHDHARDVISAWAEGFADRDGKLVLEFQSTFNSTFWELYLFACLKDLGCTVDLTKTRPDFVVTAPSPMCLEATTSNNPQDGVPEWEGKASGEKSVDLEQLVDLSTVRLANAISSKHAKYKSDYAALPHVRGLPFIIAVAPFEQPAFYMQNESAIRRVLYGYDNAIYKDFPEENRREVYGHKRMFEIAKPNGSTVPLGCFTDGRMKEVSAVVYSNTATFSKVRALSKDPTPMVFHALRFNKGALEPTIERKPKAEYRESLLDGLNVYLNDHAEVPLNPGVFERGDVTIHWFSDGMEFPMSNLRHGALFQRRCQRFVPPGTIKGRERA